MQRRSSGSGSSSRSKTAFTLADARTCSAGSAGSADNELHSADNELHSADSELHSTDIADSELHSTDIADSELPSAAATAAEGLCRDARAIKVPAKGAGHGSSRAGEGWHTVVDSVIYTYARIICRC
eukprot:9490522-Pyramimonas_sp.AAC.1